MNIRRKLTLALIGCSVASAGSVATAQDSRSSSSSSYNYSTGNGSASGSSWSSGSSSSWGSGSRPDATFGGRPPNWAPQPGFAPPTGFTPGQPTDPGFNSGLGGVPWGAAIPEEFRPYGWNHASSTNSITLEQTPIAQALATVASTTGADVKITAEAATLLAESNVKVNLRETNQTAESLLKKVANEAGLQVVVVGKAFVIAAANEDARAFTEQTLNGANSGLKTLGQVSVEAALQKPIHLTMTMTPFPFAINMLESMSGIKIQGPSEYMSMFGSASPLVQVTANGTKLVEVLESIAKQVGGKVIVEAGQISIVK